MTGSGSAEKMGLTEEIRSTYAAFRVCTLNRWINDVYTVVPYLHISSATYFYIFHLFPYFIIEHTYARTFPFFKDVSLDVPPLNFSYP